MPETTETRDPAANQLVSVVWTVLVAAAPALVGLAWAGIGRAEEVWRHSGFLAAPVGAALALAAYGHRHSGSVQARAFGSRLRRSIAVVLAVAALFGMVAAIGRVIAGGTAVAVPDPLAGAAALSGLFLIGFAAVTPSRPPVALGRAAVLAALGILLDGAPYGWGLFADAPPHDPATAALLLDFSPRAFFMESAGVDWMRHASVYEPVGTDRIGPDLRVGFGGAALAPAVLLLGSVAAAIRLRTSPNHRSALCPPADTSASFPRR